MYVVVVVVDVIVTVVVEVFVTGAGVELLVTLA
jgi:hypothetical protein